MVRVTRSSLRATSETGRDYGVRITSGDLTRLMHMARWYTMTPPQLARLELPYGHVWDDQHPTGSTPEARDEFAALTLGIRRRLSKLASINQAGTNTGPLVDGATYEYGQATWFTTAYGATAANIPWVIRSNINPMYVKHALMAADIGTHLEATLDKASFQVLSERELGTRYDHQGNALTTDFESHYTPPNGQPVGKRPDIAILGADRRSFIAVEVERRESRSITSYREKLTAYASNPNIIAVWYMCASEAIARRVSTAERRVFGGNAAARGTRSMAAINVLNGTDGWLGIPGLLNNKPLRNGLYALRTAAQNRMQR